MLTLPALSLLLFELGDLEGMPLLLFLERTEHLLLMLKIQVFERLLFCPQFSSRLLQPGRGLLQFSLQLTI